jgi:hypothetical protein
MSARWKSPRASLTLAAKIFRGKVLPLLAIKRESA